MSASGNLLRALVLFIGTSLLAGCTSQLKSEKLSGVFNEKLKVLMISYVPPSRLPATYGAIAHKNAIADLLDWSRHKAQRDKDVPVLLRLFDEGVNRFFVPALKERNVRVVATLADDPDGQIRIAPKGFSVECGAGNAFCTSKMQVEVILVSYRDNQTLWTGSFSVGQAYGVEQTHESAKKFYQQVFEKLVDLKAI